MLPLHIVTLALNARQFLLIQFSNLNRYAGNWTWHIVHGTAANTGSTKWCRRLAPGLSTDGTNELLSTWRGHPRIRIYERPMWPRGKDEMFGYALGHITESCVLLQADADEWWLPDQYARLVTLFEHRPRYRTALFQCRFFVGPNIIISSLGSYGNRFTEWQRAWRFEPGMTLLSHEPPVLIGSTEPCITHEDTRADGLVFDHAAYMFEWQVDFKEKFYGYRDAVKHWRRLQANKVWPVNNLRDYLPWVDPGVRADKLWK